jgi:hypothetical protein
MEDKRGSLKDSVVELVGGEEAGGKCMERRSLQQSSIWRRPVKFENFSLLDLYIGDLTLMWRRMAMRMMEVWLSSRFLDSTRGFRREWE